MYENVNIDSLFTLSNCFYSSFIFLAFLVCIARLLTSFHELEHGSKIILVFTIVFIYLQMDFAKLSFYFQIFILAMNGILFLGMHQVEKELGFFLLLDTIILFMVVRKMM